HVMGVCTGAFALAAAGLLDGRRATSHWYHSQLLAERYPKVKVDFDKLYIQDGPVITSAGTAAGIDACLYLVRQEYGADVANGLARRMVVSPHRDGGQAQYVDTPVPRTQSPSDDLGATLFWAQTHLEQDITVAGLAARAHMSARTFARRFTATTGTTPHQWLTAQRVFLAQRLLEKHGLDIDEVARRSGFGGGDLLRHHFAKQVGVSPSSYRLRFRHTLAMSATWPSDP
ncbi:MAG: helix-turn-helix domain-containing protein, partial [Sciscionella sp.]